MEEDVSERLARIEERLDNHITHFGQRLDAMDRKFWALILLALSSLIGLVVQYQFFVSKIGYLLK